MFGKSVRRETQATNWSSDRARPLSIEEARSHDLRQLRSSHICSAIRSTALDAQDQTPAGAAADGIFIAPFELGEIGPDLFHAASQMGLEGLVSIRRDRAYRGGRCAHWIKIKNPNSPAMKRAAEVDWCR